MKHNPFLRDLTSQEYRKFVLPTAVAGLGVLLAFLLNILIEKDIPAPVRIWLVIYIAAAAIYITTFSFYFIPVQKNKDLLVWLNAILSGGGFGALSLIIPDGLTLYFNLLLFLAVISVTIFAGRIPTILMIALATIPPIVRHFDSIQTFLGWAEHLGIAAVSLILNETATRIQNISRGQVHRLEIINAFSRQVAAATLDREQILAHLCTAIPNALVADSYYVSAIEGDEAHLLMCWDEGEYFNGMRVPAEGTLTNWVVQNQKELFLPDLRQPIELDGIKTILVGKDKTSLSWIGVPMTSSSFKGVLALASYQPNAFNRSDVELLANLAQHAALALDNAVRHAEVEERARLDSMTGVLNHGHFLLTLQRQADEALSSGTPLSLIMLDVDHFKQYNDTHGHLVGDQILIQLCGAIRTHIKNTDAVGRWGGEEFVISLPGASGMHAHSVARRIRETMRTLIVNGGDGQKILPPTVSQGIAIFPHETDDIYKLINLADQRLYVAKNRGRDQIEPPPVTNPSVP